MSNKIENPPEFPTERGTCTHFEGMDLRDWFAGRVLTGKAQYRTLGTIEEPSVRNHYPNN